MPRKKLRLNVYKKVILVFTALIIPVYLVNLWMNVMGVSFIRQQYADSNTYNLNFYANQLNEQMYFIRNLQLQLMNDPDLQKLGFMADVLDLYEKLQLVNRVTERLWTIQNASDYLLNTGVYIKEDRKTLSTRDGLSDAPNEQSELIRGAIENSPRQSLYFIEDRLFFIESSDRASIVSYLEFSVPKLRQTLSNLVQHDSAGALLTDDRFAHAISSGADERIAAAIRDSERPEPAVPAIDSFAVQVDGTKYPVLSHRIPSLGWTVYTYSDQDEITGKLRQFNIWFFVLSAISIVVIVIFSFSVNRMIHRPLHKLIRSFKMMENNPLRASSRWSEVSEFDYLFQGFDSMVATLNTSIRENYEQKIALQNSELKQLQSQINPHFLYNSFYNIYRMCKIGEYDNVSVLTQKLASYYQFITRSGMNEVPLDKEYRHAKAYCDIQSIRFVNRIQVDMPDLPDDCKPLMVPRLIIQPVLENAFEHAFENSAQPGRIAVSILREPHRLTIRIEDDGGGLSDERIAELRTKLDDPEKAAEKTGLINVGRRIRLKYGDASGLSVSRSTLGGLCADIVLTHSTHSEGGREHV